MIRDVGTELILALALSFNLPTSTGERKNLIFSLSPVWLYWDRLYYNGIAWIIGHATNPTLLFSTEGGGGLK